MKKSAEFSRAKNINPKMWDYVRDYSKHIDMNMRLANILGERFSEYRLRWKEASEFGKEFDFPLFLVFETMFKCNLRCIMCIHSSRNKQKYSYRGKMLIGTFRKIMKEASSHYCPSLTFGGTSEPLIDKDLIEMIRCAKESGFVDIMVNTNATLLNAAMSRRLIESGLTRLRIGFDGFTAATYEKIRKGAAFEKVKNNIINFIKIRKRAGSGLPVVRISCVHLAVNDREVEDFIEFWKPIVDYVSIQMYRPHEFTKKRIQMWPKNKIETGDIICSQPFERLYIRGNGDIHACCNVAFGPKVGNLHESSIYEIWNSDAMRYLRRALKDGTWTKIAACRECLGTARSI